MKLIELSGKQFGRLLVISRVPNKGKRTRWLCKCDCGNTCEVGSEELKISKTRSCGCLRKEITSENFFQNLKGHKFGKLTVLEFAGNENGTYKWKCYCECGNTKIIASGSFKSGKVKSCGCLTDFTPSILPFGIAARNQTLYSYQMNAKKRNISWELTDERAIELFLSNCYYCNTPPNSIKQPAFGNGPFVYNGIDRINNEPYYRIENTVPSCKICNMMKRRMEVKEFLLHIAKIHSFKNDIRI